MKALTNSLLNFVFLETLKINHFILAKNDLFGKPFKLSTARWRVLLAINIANTPLTISNIAKQLNQSRQGVLRLVKERLNN